MRAQTGYTRVILYRPVLCCGYVYDVWASPTYISYTLSSVVERQWFQFTIAVQNSNRRIIARCYA